MTDAPQKVWLSKFGAERLGKQLGFNDVPHYAESVPQALADALNSLLAMPHGHPDPVFKDQMLCKAHTALDEWEALKDD